MRSMALGLTGVVLLWAAGWAAGCAGDDEEKQLPSYCNPLSTDHCFLPWPSSFYLKQDSSTKTGYRVNYPVEAMAKNNNDKPVQPDRYNLLDGFSIGSQIIAYFASGVSKEGLPTSKQIATSVTDKSPVWIMEYGTGAKVPLFAETDANAAGDFVPALILRPQKPLKFNTRYVVVLRSALKDGDGQPLQPPEPFRRLRDGEETNNTTLQKEQARIGEVLSFLDQQQVKRSDVVLAWDFHTVSQDAIQGHLLGMLKTAESKLPSTGPAFSEIKSYDFTETQEPNLLRRIEGKFSVPSFLVSDDPDALLKLDAEGRPVYRGMQKFNFVVQIPRCAEKATASLPVLVFGHGIFGHYKSEINGGYHKKLIDRICMVELAATWHGMAEVDIAPIVNTAVLDWTRLPRITDRLQQAHVNFQVLVQLMKGPFLQDKTMQVNGQAVTDGKEIHYLGISLGGIMGVTFAALSKEIKRHTFHVSGGWWSIMMQRSSNFQPFDVMLDRIYEDPLDQLINIHLSQQQWDYTDPITWAGHVLDNPLPGRPKKLILMQESLYDDQVPNIATRAVSRAIGLKALKPAVEEVYGLPQAAGPLEAGYVQWDVDPKLKPPDKNVPASKPPASESAHKLVREGDTWAKSVEAFLKPDGKVINPCSGACDPD